MDSNATKAKPTKNTKPGVVRSIEIACKRLSGRALKVLEDAMNDERLEMKHRIEASKEILNRAFGRPKQAIENNITIGGGEALLEAITHARKRSSQEEVVPSVVATEPVAKDITTH